MKWPTNNFEWAVHGRAESTLRDNTTYQPTPTAIARHNQILDHDHVRGPDQREELNRCVRGGSTASRKVPVLLLRTTPDSSLRLLRGDSAVRPTLS